MTDTKPKTIRILSLPDDEKGTITEELEKSQKVSETPTKYHDGKLFIGSGEDAHIYLN